MWVDHRVSDDWELEEEEEANHHEDETGIDSVHLVSFQSSKGTDYHITQEEGLASSILYREWAVSSSLVSCE